MEDKMIIDLADIPPVPIVLGLAGENNFRSFTFDASTWGAGYPSARYNVVYKRPDGYLYPVVLNADTDELVWSPNATDTAVNGDALVEVRLLQGDVVGKTVAMQAIVLPSISGDESEPDKPAPDWVNDVSDDADRAEAAVEHYPQIRNGYWWVWDVESGKFVSTGISAQGEDGVSPTVTVTAIEGGHRVTITGADGAHTFDVMDGEGGSGGGDDVFIAVRGTTTEAEIRAAHSDGKVVICVYQNRVYYLYDDGTVTLRTAPDAQGKVFALVVTGSRWTGINYNLALASAIPTKTSQLTNDSIKEPYYLTVTTENGVTSVDKTPAEIDALSAAGYDVHLRIQVPLFGAMLDTQFTGYISRTGYAAFTNEYLGLCFAALVASDKTVELKSNDLSERLDMVENDVGVLEDQISQIAPFEIEITQSGTTFSTTATAQEVLDNADNCVAVLSGGTEVIKPDFIARNGSTVVSILFTVGVVAAGLGVTQFAVTAANGNVTVQGSSTRFTPLPDVTSADNGKFLRVVNGAWAAASVPVHDPRIAMTSTDTSATLNPNTLYVFPEMASLTITLAAPADLSIVNEYHFIFESGATATVTDFPQIPGLDDFAAETNMAYEISILEGHALVVSWEVTS